MNLDEKVIFIDASSTVDSCIRTMSSLSKKVLYPGLCVVIDGQKKFKGLITDGDIRRAYSANIDFSSSVSLIMTTKPVFLHENEISNNPVKLLDTRLREAKHLTKPVKLIPLINDENLLIDVIDYDSLKNIQNSLYNNVTVFGLGYVGITLAASLANIGHQVTGVDTNKKLIKILREGETHVHEPGLEEMIKHNLSAENIYFETSVKNNNSNIYIIAVGTPLDNNLKPGLEALNQVLLSISKVLKNGDHVMLRSTVPVGVTRDIVIPFLEKESNLLAGKDFFISFAPERTIEGDAMKELKTLPQIVGGYSNRCAELGIKFWSTLASSVVKVSSLEAAELIKLANNTFRDISFAFANELALLASKHNVDAFDLVHQANEGYPRNKIPLPSPGVGGYCLTKDPILFSCNSKGFRDDAVLGVSSRKINQKASEYPIEVLEEFCKKTNKNMTNLNILIIGIAFKGNPETNDYRGSVSLDVMSMLKKKVSRIFGWDAVITKQNINNLGFDDYDDLDDVINKSDAILILNNHPDNIISNLYENHNEDRIRLIFDGWHQLDRIDIERNPNLKYATMGYLTS